MKNARIDIGSIRREQIVEAAMSIIAQQGIQHLSLSEIEEEARMSRGQLTYYFRTKEDILLAVFHRVVELMRRRIETPNQESEADPCRFANLGAWELAQHILEKILTEPPPNPAFGALQHTFLAQSNHREDFRQALAQLYELWRADMTRRIEADLARRTPSSVSPRALASFIQALMHGLAMQKMADPEAIDAEEMIELCRDLLGNVLPLATKNQQPSAKKSRKSTPRRTTGRRTRGAGRSPRSPS
jgi:AcrR family transcriptional regulator